MGRRSALSSSRFAAVPRAAPAGPAMGVSDPGCETLSLPDVSPAREWALRVCVHSRGDRNKTRLPLVCSHPLEMGKCPLSS